MKGLEAQLFVHRYSSGALGQHVINIPMFTSGPDYSLSSFMTGEGIFGSKELVVKEVLRRILDPA